MRVADASALYAFIVATDTDRECGGIAEKVSFEPVRHVTSRPKES